MLPIKSVARREDLPYEVVGSLGHGGYGTVLEVSRRSDNERFALKIMYTQRQNRAFLMETLREEVKIIQALQDHHHFIHVADAYEAKNEIGLVMWPVADRRSLAQCLDEYLDTPDLEVRNSLRQIFERAFGCLAEGLAWMHQQRIRHKDIKPANILVHDGQILYCDFGCSLDSRLVDSSTTEGPARTTRKYMAPEVIASEPRNSASDVYSLGCIFLEMQYALMLNIAVKVITFSSEMQIILGHLIIGIENKIELPNLILWVNLIREMTHDQPSSRASIKVIASNICRYSYCCNICGIIQRRLGPPKELTRPT
ncbi:kinase-like domain-containing protein [Phaeosphaeria sp. MPI-PUGE-AT-0046c]|nr:kinase-like domain-containing protein [Phaeosphaeria sp. MPI-PUGE-AT-0046c]